jgi:hypothetical protein
MELRKLRVDEMKIPDNSYKALTILNALMVQKKLNIKVLRELRVDEMKIPDNSYKALTILNSLMVQKN